MKQTLKEVTYTCTCGHKQIITFFPDDTILPVTCCVKCRAGFGVELRDMIAFQKGMFPSKPVVIAA